MVDPTNILDGIKFPTFQEERIFIASSGDLSTLRKALYEWLNGFLRRHTSTRQIQAYEWETCISDAPFDQRITMQENLGRPSDPNCVATICLLGERIGNPLNEIDPITIIGFDDWTSDKNKYQLIFPWPKDLPSQLECVSKGGFPLTGSVFEYLDAQGAGKNIYLAYFANTPISIEQPQISLNGEYWKSIREADFKSQHPQNYQEQQIKWRDSEYKIQTQSVINFLCAISQRSLYVKHFPPINNNKIKLSSIYDEIEKFIKLRVSPDKEIADRNPYQFLDYYDLNDSDFFFGRDESSKTVLTELKSSFAENKPKVIQISGESGCGKSSFLRAGILAKLKDSSSLYTFRVIAIRPTDFHDESGLPSQTLVKDLVELIAIEISELNLSASIYKQIDSAGYRHPKKAVEILTEAIDAFNTTNQKNLKIIIGLDQFEEIIDDLVNSNNQQNSKKNQWHNLTKFIEGAMSTGKFGFIYTLESSRKKSFNAVDLPESIKKAFEVKLGGASDNFIENIITEPFKAIGLQFDNTIVEKLLQTFEKLNKTSQASALPLLSLKLSNLFTKLSEIHLLGQKSNDSLSESFKKTLNIITLEDINDDLEIGNEIHELAHKAWTGKDNIASTKISEKEISELNPIMHALVSMNSEGHLTLRTVSDNAFEGLKNNILAFEKHRLVIKENGRRRLIHEAVVHQWPLAKAWLTKKEEYFSEESIFRINANKWYKKSQQLEDMPTDEMSIDFAATILRNHVQDWAKCNDLDSSDDVLKKYCIKIFEHCTTPTKTDYEQRSYISLATLYELKSLVEKFIQLEPSSINFESKDKYRPIFSAAWTSKEMVEIFINAGANPICFDEKEYSPICCAIQSNNLEIFKLLWPFYRDNRENLKARDGNLLHLAASSGEGEILNMILSDAKDLINLSMTDKGGFTPLNYAIFSNKISTFNILLNLSNIKQKNPFGYTVLHLTVIHGRIEMMEALLNHVDIEEIIYEKDHWGRNALMLAAEYRHNKIISRIAVFYDVNEALQTETKESIQGWTALHFAVNGEVKEKEKEEYSRETSLTKHHAFLAVKALLSADNLNLDLETIAGKKLLEMAENLPQVKKAIVNQYMNSLSHQDVTLESAILFGLSDKIEKHIKEWATSTDQINNINEKTSYILKLLLDKKMTAYAKELLKIKSINPWEDPQLIESNGFFSSVKSKHIELVDLYLNKLSFPLSEQIKLHLDQVIRYLIRQRQDYTLFENLITLGAPLDITDKSGWSLLHLASLIGDCKKYTMLKQHIKNVSKDKFGRMPLDLASDYTREQLLSI